MTRHVPPRRASPVLQAVEFIRQRRSAFVSRRSSGAVDRQLAGFAFEQLTFRAEDTAKIPPLELLLVVNAFRQIIARHIQLNAAAYVLWQREALPYNTASHHTARDGHFNIQRLQFFSLFRVKPARSWSEVRSRRKSFVNGIPCSRSAATARDAPSFHC